MFIYTSHHSTKSIISKPQNHITRFTQSKTAYKQAYKSKLHIIELSRKITKQKFHIQEVIRVSYDPYASIRVSPYLIRVSYAIHQNSKWPRNQLIRVSALPYAYHQNYVPLSKFPYAYEHPHTLSYAKHQYVVFGTGQLRIIRV